MSLAAFKPRNTQDFLLCVNVANFLNLKRLKHQRDTSGCYFLSFCSTYQHEIEGSSVPDLQDPHTHRVEKTNLSGENWRWRLEVRWCERFTLLQVECEEQMKGELPSSPPSKQRGESSHTTVHGRCFLKPSRTTWWIWPRGISGPFWKWSRPNSAANEKACLLGCVSAATLHYQRSHIAGSKSVEIISYTWAITFMKNTSPADVLNQIFFISVCYSLCNYLVTVLTDFENICRICLEVEFVEYGQNSKVAPKT